jgi:hypothetical protein
MRVAVVFFPLSQKIRLQSLVRSLSKGIESQGNQVDVIDGKIDLGKKLTIYRYICILTESTGFFGQIPGMVSHFLKDAGNLIGKRCSAFVLKSILGSEKAIVRLMKIMEKEGMYLTYSDKLKIPEYAEDIGKQLHIMDKD